MNRLDRDGVFRCRATGWRVKTFQSKSVAVGIDFVVLEELVNGEWRDWTQYGEYAVSGDWWVIGSSGAVNTGAVEQLSECMGWDGSLSTVATSPCPGAMMQVTVKEETYNGKTLFKGDWMRPWDYSPQAPGADSERAQVLDAQFGGLLRAAASKGRGVKKTKPAAAPPAEAAPAEKPPTDYGDIPF